MVDYSYPEVDMIDIHMHILAGLDDGAMDLEEALMMMARAESSGISTIIATPHSWAVDDMEKIKKEVTKLNDAACDAKIEVKVTEGCEFNVMRGEAIRRMGERLKELTLAGSRYLLTEFSNSAPGRTVLSCVQEITAMGLVPIIAHPERIVSTWDDMDIMRSARDLGALGQISMGDVIGRNGMQSMEASLTMIEEGLCQFCATDAHTPDKLAQYMKAQEEVGARYGKEPEDRLFRLNPQIVLSDGDCSGIRGALE